jgi:hypothetical protein
VSTWARFLLGKPATAEASRAYEFSPAVFLQRLPLKRLPMTRPERLFAQAHCRLRSRSLNSRVSLWKIGCAVPLYFMHFSLDCNRSTTKRELNSPTETLWGRATIRTLSAEHVTTMPRRRNARTARQRNCRRLIDTADDGTSISDAPERVGFRGSPTMRAA